MRYEPPSITIVIYRTIWLAVVIGALVYAVNTWGHTSDIPGECTHPDCVGVR